MRSNFHGQFGRRITWARQLPIPKSKRDVLAPANRAQTRLGHVSEVTVISIDSERALTAQGLEPDAITHQAGDDFTRVYWMGVCIRLKGAPSKMIDERPRWQWWVIGVLATTSSQTHTKQQAKVQMPDCQILHLGLCCMH